MGLRQSLGVAWLALIVAEQVNASSGLGYLINNARDFNQTDVVVVGLLAYAVLGPADRRAGAPVRAARAALEGRRVSVDGGRPSPSSACAACAAASAT